MQRSAKIGDKKMKVDTLQTVNDIFDVNQLFSDFFGNSNGLFNYANANRVKLPDLQSDMYVEGGVLKLNVNIPGVEKEQVKLDYNSDKHKLTVKVSSQYEKKEDKPNFYIRERNISESQRSFQLPSGADASTITAKINNGLLSIEMKVNEISPPIVKSIEIS